MQRKQNEAKETMKYIKLNADVILLYKTVKTFEYKNLDENAMEWGNKGANAKSPPTFLHDRTYAYLFECLIRYKNIHEFCADLHGNTHTHTRTHT